MSHPMPHEEEDHPTLKPRPRRPFELASPPPSSPSTPPAEGQTVPSTLSAPGVSTDNSSTPSRTRSLLNLTSSTLFGIYQPTGYGADREEPTTPWGTGAETPLDGSRRPSADIIRAGLPDTMLHWGPNGGVKSRRRSTAHRIQFQQRPRRKGFRGYYLPRVARTGALFAVGMLYGLLTAHLHDRRELAPVKIESVDRYSWPYLFAWGLAGICLGEALPLVDKFWVASPEDAISDDEETEQRDNRTRGLGGWNDVIRSVGAFVGIAFAIRKLPWQSTLQLSLTLALANPAVWYLIDRSGPGLVLSSTVAIGGTAVLLGINPALVPAPSAQAPFGSDGGMPSASNGTAGGLVGEVEELVLGVFSAESVGVATWIASVLFVSSVCFGNIGRRLAARG